jgi:hypothetical protein
MSSRDRRNVKNDDSFFSMKENQDGASVGNFVANIKEIAKIPSKVIEALTSKSRKKRR